MEILWRKILENRSKMYIWPILLGKVHHDNPLMATNLGFYKVSLDIDAILH